MIPSPNILSLLPSDMKSASNDLMSIYMSPIPSFSPSHIFISLYSAEYPDKAKAMRRVPKRKSTEPPQNLINSSITKYYLPDIYFPPNNLKKKEKIKEIASHVAIEHSKSKKKKQFAECGRNTSYRKLFEQRNLESHFTSHFILNHKFKILMWGCVAAVGHVSDDEGNESRNGNPLYNIDIANKKYDELADIDIQSEQTISSALKAIVQENQKSQQLRKTSLSSSSLANSAIEERRIFLGIMSEAKDEMNKFPIIEAINFDIDFNFDDKNEKYNTKIIPYTEFSLILSILMNAENISLSLRIGSEIRNNLNIIRVLIHQSIENINKFQYKSNCPYHLICDFVSAKFLYITFEIINSLWKTLSLPLDWTFTMIVRFFKEKKICLTEALDELTSEFAKSVDDGGNYAREMLKFRELACIVDMNLFSTMVQEECEKFKSGKPCSTKDLVRIARGYNPYFPLLGVNVSFTKNNEIYLEISSIPDSLQLEEQSLFPVFNMFDGIYSLDEESLKTLVY